MPALVLAAVAALVLPPAVAAALWVLRPGVVAGVVADNLSRGLLPGTVATAGTAGTAEARTASGAVLRALTPDRVAGHVRRALGRAGSPAGWTMARVLWAKLAGAAVGATAGGAVLAARPGLPAVLVLLALTAGLYVLPDVLLHGRGEERRELLARELPDVLDQTTIAVEAGLGFDAALTRTTAGGRGALAAEFATTLQDVAVGRPRRDAYDALARRTDVPDLARFVRAVNQADEFGIAMADVLRVQADEMRVKRRQRAEEKAMKIPVTVLFPLMLCILPALLVVLVGPAVLGVAESFGG
ncbi:type II secretion system F family protein [Modestobacter sp. Leaf380]|uniref:type II secretion system F family protein n=1 Tax=Modestobacter sp. Leaf380 TaxID=1736356 RepID=UPI0009EA012C|nr:type II secretion system F family protein [Modestobacter sp. Leaf380]